MIGHVLEAEGEPTLIITSVDDRGNWLAQPVDFGETVTLTHADFVRYDVIPERPQTVSEPEGWERIGRQHDRGTA